VFGASAYEGGGRSPVAISLAIGGATLPADGRTATELIAAADGGLYREKRAGRLPPRRVARPAEGIEGAARSGEALTA
jgi:GGDEF domain-containing protein